MAEPVAPPALPPCWTSARLIALLDLRPADRRFGYPLEMVLRAADGWRIVKTKVDHLPGKGRFTATGTLRGTMRAVSETRRVMVSAPHGESASSRG